MKSCTFNRERERKSNLIESSDDAEDKQVICEADIVGVVRLFVGWQRLR